MAALAVLALVSCASEPEPVSLDRATAEELSFLQNQGTFANSSFVVVDGTVLHFRSWGPPGLSGPPALLIHGLGASTYSFREIAPWLAEQGYRVLAVDVPPFGYSDRRRSAVAADRAGIFLSLLDRFAEDPSLLGTRVDDPWLLVGHSLGGRIAAGMAIERPDLVDSLVLLAGALQLPENRASLPLITTDPVSRLLQAGLRQLGSPDSLATVLANAYGRMPTEEEIQGYYEPFAVPGTIPAVVRFSSEALQQIGPLAELKRPTLLIWGNEDTWVPIAVGYRAGQEIADSLMVVVPGAAHIPMETEPEAVRRAIALFLEEQG